MSKIFFLLIISLFLAELAFTQDQNIPYATDSMPGILVDAGGHKLHLNTQGKGSPTVIFENGSGDFSFIWTLVQTELSKYTQTVSYDRAGYAWSEPGPMRFFSRWRRCTGSFSRTHAPSLSIATEAT